MCRVCFWESHNFILCLLKAPMPMGVELRTHVLAESSKTSVLRCSEPACWASEWSEEGFVGLLRVSRRMSMCPSSSESHVLLLRLEQSPETRPAHRARP